MLLLLLLRQGIQPADHRQGFIRNEQKVPWLCSSIVWMNLAFNQPLCGRRIGLDQPCVLQ
jgi:hypothetical protein